MIVRSSIKSLLAILLFLTGSESNNGGLASAYRRSDAYGSVYEGRTPAKKAMKACLAAAAFWSFSCLQVVTSGDECLVERFGMYNRKLGPGWHFVLKPFETVR